MNPKVSIIVPVYNVEKFFKRCLDSMRAQTLEDIEIILVDDGSTDSSAVICDSAAMEDSRIKVIHKQNSGAGLSRNAGLEVATGEYIGFVDSDDYIDANMYEVLYNTAKNHNADMVMSGVRFVGGNMFRDDGNAVEKNFFEKETVFEGKDVNELQPCIIGSMPHEADDSRYGMSIWKNLFKRSVITENKITFESERIVMTEDAIFILDFLHFAKKVVGIKGVFYNYFRNDSSISKSYRENQFERCIAFINEVKRRIERDIPFEKYGIYIDRFTIAFARVVISQEVMFAKENNISYKDLRKRFKSVRENGELDRALKNYPWYRLPVKYAVFTFALKYRMYFLQKLIVEIRDR